MVQPHLNLPHVKNIRIRTLPGLYKWPWLTVCIHVPSAGKDASKKTGVPVNTEKRRGLQGDNKQTDEQIPTPKNQGTPNIAAEYHGPWRLKKKERKRYHKVAGHANACCSSRLYGMAALYYAAQTCIKFQRPIQTVSRGTKASGSEYTQACQVFGVHINHRPERFHNKAT